MIIKELIIKLLDESPYAELVFRDKDGKELEVKTISVKEQKSIPALFA
jgi:hypothetical protein